MRRFRGARTMASTPKEATMTLLALRLPPQPPRSLLSRAGTAIRDACCITSGRCALDCVQEPAGLRYPPSPRARRLMRQAQVSAW